MLLQRRSSEDGCSGCKQGWIGTRQWPSGQLGHGRGEGEGPCVLCSPPLACVWFIPRRGCSAAARDAWGGMRGLWAPLGCTSQALPSVIRLLLLPVLCLPSPSGAFVNRSLWACQSDLGFLPPGLLILIKLNRHSLAYFY